MKSVQIQRQGKVKDVRASAAAAGLPTEEIDTTVALIHALILSVRRWRPRSSPW